MGVRCQREPPGDRFGRKEAHAPSEQVVLDPRFAEVAVPDRRGPGGEIERHATLSSTFSGAHSQAVMSGVSIRSILRGEYAAHGIALSCLRGRTRPRGERVRLFDQAAVRSSSSAPSPDFSKTPSSDRTLWPGEGGAQRRDRRRPSAAAGRTHPLWRARECAARSTHSPTDPRGRGSCGPVGRSPRKLRGRRRQRWNRWRR